MMKLLRAALLAGSASAASGAKVCSDPAPLQRFGAGSGAGVGEDGDSAPGSALSFVQVNDLEHAAKTQSCEWVVHYDTWDRSFDEGEYEHADHGGAHCLDACCKDPNCHGLELMSSEIYQCYRFSHMPASLQRRSGGGRMLGDGRWAMAKVPRWSAFMKLGAPGVVRPSPAALLQLGGGKPPAEDDGAKYEALAQRLKNSPKLQKCGWTVYYDMWVPTFERGEYEPSDDALGGAHCLEACCQDPQCEGLALESIEKYQCYRYMVLPTKQMARLAPHGGRPLGDAAWLRQRRGAWSVFVKQPAGAAAQGQSLPLPRRAPASATAAAWGGVAGEVPAGSVGAPPATSTSGALGMAATLAAFAFLVLAQCSAEAPGRRSVLKMLQRHGAKGSGEGLELVPKK